MDRSLDPTVSLIRSNHAAPSHPTLPPPRLPPPSSPLPDLPLQAKAPAPPSTPRNASDLYGEFSWPSLDVAALVSRLEDVAETTLTSGALCVNGLEGLAHVVGANGGEGDGMADAEAGDGWQQSFERGSMGCKADDVDDGMNDADADDSGFLNSNDWAELLNMLSWLGGFDGEAQEQLLELNSRRGDRRREGAVIEDKESDEGMNER
ncbi:MAG: hypothetical protein Q9170_006360 [Blastenia crenularia]